MEDVRTWTEDDEQWHIPDDERDYSTPEDEVPFHIPRDQLGAPASRRLAGGRPRPP